MLAYRWHRHFAKKLFRPWGERRVAAINEDITDLNTEEPEASDDISAPDTGGERYHIANVLETSQSVEERCKAVRERLTFLQKFLEKHKDHPEVQKASTDIRQWNEGISARILLVAKLQSKQSEWDKGILEPEGYCDAINEYLNSTTRGEKQVSLEPALQIPASVWLTLNKQHRWEKKNAVHNALDAQGIAYPLKGAEDILDGIEEQLKENESAINEFARNLESHSSVKAGQNILRNAIGMVTGIRLASINDVISAFKKYGEGVKNAWTNRSERISATLASNIGSVLRFLPLGNEIQSELSTAREAKNDEEKEKEKKQLEQSSATFKLSKLLLRKFARNPNKFNGVMEYMAEHGWLYELSEKNRTLFGIKVPVPTGWNSETAIEYLIRMHSKDSDGQDAQKKRATNVIGTADSIPPIIDFLKTELENHNYWAAYAALEIAMRKGKIGESGTWVATVLLRHIRSNPDAMKYLSIDIFDQMGNLGISHPAWTSTFLKLDRKELDAWKNTNDPKRFKHAGNLANTIALIEEEIREKCGPIPEEDLDRHVAKVLSAQTVNINGKAISIFSSRYSKYRKKILSTDTTIDPSKADDDFFGYVSDAHLIGIGGLRSIFQITTQGGFQHTTKANNYIKNIFKLDKMLEEENLESAQMNFRNEMRNKLDTYFEEDVKRHGATQLGWAARKSEGKVVIEEFVRKNMLSQSVYNSVFRKAGKSGATSAA